MTNKNDKWIPWYFVLFFATIAICDAVFVGLALSTHRGLVTEHAYQKGLEYNHTIAAAEQQDGLNWQGRLEFDQSIVSLFLRDANDQPIQRAEVTAYMFRVTQDGYDFDRPLIYRGNGLYSSPVVFPLKGQWDITVSVSWLDSYYQKKQRIFVK